MAERYFYNDDGSYFGATLAEPGKEGLAFAGKTEGQKPPPVDVPEPVDEIEVLAKVLREQSNDPADFDRRRQQARDDLRGRRTR